MCGIVAALPTYQGLEQGGEESATLTAAADDLPRPPWPAEAGDRDPQVVEKALVGIAEQLDALQDDLDRPAVAARLVVEDEVRGALADGCRTLTDWATELDRRLDVVTWDADVTDVVQGALRRLSDRLHAVLHDRVLVAERARSLVPAPAEPSPAAATSYLALTSVLDALNRLEVRGRDSAGVTLWVHLDEADRQAAVPAVATRQDPLLRNGAALVAESGLCFVYKHAAVIGKLGDNVAALQEHVHADAALHRVLAMPSARVTVLAHTRWASVGRISEANAHPVDSHAQDGSPDGPLALAVLNGDIDNYADIRERLRLHPDELGISTDAKVIPLVLSERLAAGDAAGPAMGAGLAEFAGSMAIAALADGDDGLLLGVKGSGQGLHVGLAPFGFVVASEVYGLVASAPTYLRLDGGLVDGATRPGTVVRLVRSGAGTPEGLHRWNGDGTPAPLRPDELRTAEVTTRDLALGAAEHYLHKEIHEAPSSFRKTLRGRVRVGPAGPAVVLPESSLPQAVRERLRSGAVGTVLVIGQGTAAVAGQGIVEVIRTLTGDRLTVTALPATEFSAWRLRPDMSDVCVVAVSQSGTTTDTNRAVDLARDRGAAVVSIVNRRESDLAAKSDGVIYTSDGRDVEMAVASTKAFYAQAAAGCLLGIELAREVGALTPDREASLLTALQEVPERLHALHDLEPRLATAAAEVVTRYPYWTVVGSGPSRVAAAEIRIKLSELCYKTISTDAVEDKKHIDLSAGALVLVCVAGAPVNQLSDLAKEVEIFAAHGNRPVVLCDAGTEHLWPAETVVGIPAGHRDLAWILTTAAGHLFAYHAARSIDTTADPLRRALARLESSLDAGRDPAAQLPPDIVGPVTETLDRAAAGELSGVLTSQAALRLTGVVPGSPTSRGLPGFGPAADEPATAARAALTQAIDELTRSIDTVKHQAKTVTVGTSRDDADLYDNDVVGALEAAGGDRGRLSLAALRIMRAHSRVIAETLGVTRYRVDRQDGAPTIVVTRKTGVAEHLRSRADDRPVPLTGSKGRVADLGQPRLVRGRLDGRVVLVVPEQDDRHVTNLSVVHVALRSPARLDDLLAALASTGDRLEEVRAVITETAPSFDPEWLLSVPIEDALLSPVDDLAEQLVARRGG